MSDARLEQFTQMVAEFPDEPTVHFSLGKLLLERRDYAGAVQSLETAVRLDATYAAAFVSLGEAHAGANQVAQAREAFTRARELALAQKHRGLAQEIDERLKDLG